MATAQLSDILLPAGGLTVALDHGLGGVPRGLEAAPGRVRELLDYRPDGVIVTVGMMRALGDEILERGIQPIAAIDAAIGEDGRVVGRAEVASIEQCVQLGCVCVKIVFQLGWRGETFCDEITRIARAVTVAHEVGIPIMIEPAMIGGDPDGWTGAETARIMDGCRISSELGADMLKIPMLDLEHTRDVVEMSWCPVTVMGGDAKSQPAFLAEVEACLEAGARGIVAGRNVWQEGHEQEVITALRQLLQA